MKDYTIPTHGICPRSISFSIENGKIYNVKFFGGCPGNTVGVATLVKGRPVDEVISLLEGIPCGMKRTSCPDQLAQALKEIRSNF